MLKSCAKTWLFMLLVVTVCSSCQREEPAEKAGAQSQQPAGVVEQAVQQTVDGIKGPMDKARSVEGTLEKAAERVGEQVQESTR
ncbi:MAG TPA: hypothetical protein VIR79_06020 [Nitrospira sp.]